MDIARAGDAPEVMDIGAGAAGSLVHVVAHMCVAKERWRRVLHKTRVMTRMKLGS